MKIEYKCSKCGVENVKLWRQYQTLACYVDLLCAYCAMEDQDKVGVVGEDGRRQSELGDWTDQIGWLVPAVPTVEMDTYWGYTSVPQDRVEWWKKLPIRA